MNYFGSSFSRICSVYLDLGCTKSKVKELLSAMGWPRHLSKAGFHLFPVPVNVHTGVTSHPGVK